MADREQQRRVHWRPGSSSGSGNAWRRPRPAEGRRRGVVPRRARRKLLIPLSAESKRRVLYCLSSEAELQLREQLRLEDLRRRHDSLRTQDGSALLSRLGRRGGSGEPDTDRSRHSAKLLSRNLSEDLHRPQRIGDKGDLTEQLDRLQALAADGHASCPARGGSGSGWRESAATSIGQPTASRQVRTRAKKREPETNVRSR